MSLEKKRKVCIISWFYLIGSIIFVLFTIGLGVFLMYYLFVYKKDIGICIGIIVFSFIAAIFFLIIFGILFWQWVKVDSKGIKARNIFGIIRELTWEEIVEIQCIPIRYNVLDPIMEWFMFIDKNGNRTNVTSPFNIKGQCIKIKASKRTREFLLQIKPDLKFTEYHGA